MIPKGFICFNGEFFAAPSISPNCLTESKVASGYVRTSGSVPLLLDFVVESIRQQMRLVNCLAHFDGDYLEKNIVKTLNKNRSLKGGLVFIEVLANQLDTYSIDLQLSFQPIDNYRFELNRKGLSIDLFTFCPKPKGLLFSHPIACEFVFGLAFRQIQEKKVDELIILNPSKRLACGVGSLIFLVRGDKVLTVSYEEGAFVDPMFVLVEKLAKENELQFSSDLKLTVNDILISDEVFFADMKYGIRWVVAFGSKRFYSRVSSILTSALDKMAFS